MGDLKLDSSIGLKILRDMIVCPLEGESAPVVFTVGLKIGVASGSGSRTLCFNSFCRTSEVWAIINRDWTRLVSVGCFFGSVGELALSRVGFFKLLKSGSVTSLPATIFGLNLNRESERSRLFYF
jgi:hypothetical protein